jgi:hypothetical protein
MILGDLPHILEKTPGQALSPWHPKSVGLCPPGFDLAGEA